MKSRNRYIIVGVCLLFMALIVAIYSTYTYSAAADNNSILANNVVIEQDGDLQLRMETFSGVIEEKYHIEQTEDYESVFTVNGVNPNTGTQLPSEYVLSHVPINRVQKGGTCWAFSSINALEATIANTNVNTQYGNSKRINPYHMIHALDQSVGNQKNVYGYRDETNIQGGTPLNVLMYLTNGTAFTTSTSYYYHQGKPDDAHYSQGNLTLNGVVNGETENYQVKKVQVVPGISTDRLDEIGVSNYPDDANVKEKIRDIKLLIRSGKGVTIFSRSTQRDDNPCYRTDKYAAYCPKSLINSVSGHMTLIVGWDDNYSKSNFTKDVNGKHNPGPPANGAWKIRNSYSYSGYYYISYYDYTSLYNSNIAITEVMQKSYDNLYQYNPSGCDAENNCFQLDDAESRILNVFSKQTNGVEKLKSVGFYAEKIGSNNKVSVYFKDGVITGGNYDSLFSQDNYLGMVDIPASGFYTFDLSGSQDISVTSNKFIIGLKPIYNNTLKIQAKSNDLMTNSEVGIKEGRSYYYDGSVYRDLSTYDIPSTGFLKAYTVNTQDNTGGNSSGSSDEITYTVRHLQERLDGGYQLKDTETLKGRAGQIVPQKNYEGFIKPTSKVLSSDTSVVEYKYDRNSYTVTLTRTRGISGVKGGGNYKFGQTVTIDATLASGYTWSRWTGESTSSNKKNTFTMPSHDVIYTAVAASSSGSAISVKGINIDNCPSEPIIVGESMQLNTSINPSNATDKRVLWSVPSFNIVTINDNGTIRGVSAGTVMVTATTVDGEYQAKCKITVGDDAKENQDSNPSKSSSKNTVTIKIDKQEISLLKDNEYKLTATVKGSSGKVIWSSKNDKIASVKDGVVKAVSLGSTTIMAKIEGTNISASVKVSVITENERGIKLAKEEMKVFLNREAKVDIITIPTDMVIESIDYEFDNEDVIMITNGVVRGLKEGTSKIKVTVNGQYKAEGTITVLKEPLMISVTSYNLNFNENTYSYSLKIGKEDKLVITSNKDIVVEGNENLKNNSIIRVTETEDNREYTIRIIKNNNSKYYFIGIIGVLVLVNLFRLIKVMKKKKK